MRHRTGSQNGSNSALGGKCTHRMKTCAQRRRTRGGSVKNNENSGTVQECEGENWGGREQIYASKGTVQICTRRDADLGENRCLFMLVFKASRSRDEPLRPITRATPDTRTCNATAILHSMRRIWGNITRTLMIDSKLPAVGADDRTTKLKTGCKTHHVSKVAEAASAADWGSGAVARARRIARLNRQAQ